MLADEQKQHPWSQNKVPEANTIYTKPEWSVWNWKQNSLCQRDVPEAEHKISQSQTIYFKQSDHLDAKATTILTQNSHTHTKTDMRSNAPEGLVSATGVLNIIVLRKGCKKYLNIKNKI